MLPLAGSSNYGTMETKRPGHTLFDTLSNLNMGDHKIQLGGKISKDTSSRSKGIASLEQERDNKREENWRREIETEKMRDKARYREMDTLERYERDRTPTPRLREGERERRERERRQEDDRGKNWRPLSNMEKEIERDAKKGKKKGDTFPRMIKGETDSDRRRMSSAEIVEERSEMRPRGRPRREEMEEWERERHRYRERDEIREKEEWRNRGGRPADDERSRQRERYKALGGQLQDRTGEGVESWDTRDRDTARKREKPRSNTEEREARMNSPHRRPDRDIYSDRKERGEKREGRRDARSEGDGDERELRRENELLDQLSRSEGDSRGKMASERDRDEQRYRERKVDKYRRGGGEGNRGERYREADRREARHPDRREERWKESGRGLKNDRREDDKYREERRGREKKERREDATGRDSRSLSDSAPRVLPQSQSSGEWSSDLDSETKYRRDRDSCEERETKREGKGERQRSKEGRRHPERSERRQITSERKERDRRKMIGSTPEQRRMWLEPQRGKNSIDEYEDRERQTRRKEGRSEEEKDMESQAHWGRDGRRVKEEPDERYFDQSSHQGRRGGRNEFRGYSEGVGADGEGEIWRKGDKRGKAHLSDSDGGIVGSQQRNAEGENLTDNTEESDREEEGGSDNWARSRSEGGSEAGWKQDKGRMLSEEDGFVTPSSGGDEEDERRDDEDEFKDCQEIWEGGPTFKDPTPAGFKGCEGEKEREEVWTVGKEESVDEEEQEGENKSKYVFCVIGQTLSRSENGEMSLSQGDERGGAERESPNLETQNHSSDDHTHKPPDELPLTPKRNDDQPVIYNQDSEEDHYTLREEILAPGNTAEGNIQHRAPPVLRGTESEDGMKSKLEPLPIETGIIKRDSQTERLLKEWREQNKELAGIQCKQTPVSGNPYADLGSMENLEKIQPFLNQLNTEAMSPEELEAIRIRMSGAWSMSEEPKRRSQAPHLKWAKDVVREILGKSEEQANDESNSDAQEDNQSEENKQQEKVAQSTVEVPVVTLTKDEKPPEPGVQEEDLMEEFRDDEDDRSKSWGEVELRNVLDTIERRKRNSKIFNASPLYQQYSEAAQNFEILRQSRSDVLSVCEENTPSPARSPVPSPPPARRPLPPLPSVPHPHSWSRKGSVISCTSLPLPEPPKNEGRPSSPRLSISLTQSATLWRELPAVRNSAELEELGEDEWRLQEVRFEVVTSEASYCRSLDIVVEHFVKSKQLGALLATQDRNWLFSRLADVRAISHSFLTKLEERVESDIINFTVCDIIARHCQRFRMVYVPYLTNQSYQDATYQRLMNENQEFKRIVAKLERSPVCQRLPLRSFLVLPFQRITRLKLLVQNIVKRTTPGTAEAAQAIKALKHLEKLIQESNDSITQMKSIESLVSLSAKVDFECRTLPLISQSRRLVREGLVTELMDFSLKDTERNLYWHLFNDYLLVSLQKEGGRFTVIDHSPVSELRVENCRVKLHSLQKNLFRLYISQKALLLRTDTQSHKLRWISALSRPHTATDFSAAQDFAQMQCIRAFVAQQPDELSLEKADVILVHQDSSDNWVEGTKLSDRHRGWVPKSHLENISSSRVRQRNLSDALKLTTATAAV
ncbi:uncharacterized protein arhgef5 isoform 3-T3 [Odontesthes bonariensis]|uniref:uncharacterized protein arhgef5 isoform X3 n=1 Tax=Odontesthes bonariensis TaxID=219752 RepID=UPI003F58385D